MTKTVKVPVVLDVWKGAHSEEQVTVFHGSQLKYGDTFKKSEGTKRYLAFVEVPLPDDAVDKVIEGTSPSVEIP
jgi:hypothetical protein